VEIAERYKDKKIAALDISEKRLKMFADQAQKYAIRQVLYDFFEFKTDPVDLLISQEVLEHLPDVEKAMKKMRTFIRSGGFAIFCVPYEENLESKMITDPATGERYHKNGHLHSFTRSTLIDYAVAAGFTVLKVKLNANKRLVRWFTKLNISVTTATCRIYDLMNRLFPHKSAYIAILCRNMNE
jgi:2-polyprenyl-3-methyl-5-hydroxy-6-metoxy-1,4-benzoquinol methylase